VRQNCIFTSCSRVTCTISADIPAQVADRRRTISEGAILTDAFSAWGAWTTDQGHEPVLADAGRACGSETTLGCFGVIEAYAALRNITLCQLSVMALTSASMSASLCRGVGVSRSRSVPRGTVG
jgi:hypothetical protein